MQQVTANVCVKHTPFIPVPGYIYDIQGIKVLLHEDIMDKGTYACSEFSSGKTLSKQKPTMQEALDTATSRILILGVDAVKEQIQKTVGESGYANK